MSKDIALIKSGNYELTAEQFDSIFDPASMAKDLSAGVSSGFGIISIRGSKWRIKKGGEETPILDDKGDPVARLEVVILKAPEAMSKVYYEGKYVEGSTDEPDCSSNDGIKPDAGVPNQQAKTCAACPRNEWGSRITESGKKAKECSDSRRVAVVMADDLAGANFDGPLLLRVPPASLQDLKIYGDRMAAKSAPYNIIVTALGFDLDTAYPKLTFKAVKPLTREQRMPYAQFYFDGSIDAVLDTKIEVSTRNVPDAPVNKAVDTDFEEAEDDPELDDAEAEEIAANAEAAALEKKKAAAAAKRKVAAAKKKAAEEAASKLAAEPVAEAVDADLVAGMDDTLDEMMKNLDA